MGGLVKGITDGLGITTGSKDAAISHQANSAADANFYLRQGYDRQMEHVAPWQKAGLAGLAGLQNFNFQEDPGYQFRLNQGLQGLNSALAARGMGRSGAALKALTGYNQNFAANEYNNAYNRNFNTMSYLAGLGQNAYQNAAGYAGAYGSGNADIKMGLGNANAAAEIGHGNKLANLAGMGFQGLATYAGMGGGGKGTMQSQVMPQNYNNFSGLSGYNWNTTA